jgi:hypothetical protein
MLIALGAGTTIAVVVGIRRGTHPPIEHDEHPVAMEGHDPAGAPSGISSTVDEAGGGR